MDVIRTLGWSSMLPAARRLVFALALTTAIATSAPALAQQGDWPGWRGDGSGVSAERDLPAQWSKDSGIAWKTRIRGTGNSSPVVHGDRVFVTTSLERRMTEVLRSALWWATVGLAAVVAIAVLVAGARAVRQGTWLASGSGAVWYRSVLTIEGLVVLGVTFWFFRDLVELLRVGQTRFTPQDPDFAWIATGEVAALGLIAFVGALKDGWPKLGGAVCLGIAALGFHLLQPPAEATMPVPVERQMGVLVPLGVAAGWFLVSWALGRLARHRAASKPVVARLVRQVGVLSAAVLMFAFFNVVEPRLGLRRAVIAVDRDSGEILWSRGVFAPSGRKWKTNTYATPTVATDGEYIVADFGPRLVVMNAEGRELWMREEPLYMRYLRYGAAKSPVIWNDRLIYAYFPENPDTSTGRITGEASYMAALELATGRELWRVEAIAGGHDAYATPLIVPTDDGALVAIAVEDHVHTFDVRTGAHHGRFEMPLSHPVPGPVSDGETIYVAGGIYGPQGAAAVEIGSPGVSRSGPRELEARWTTNRQTPDIASPLVYDGLLYWVTENGRMFCHDALTGEVVWRQRLNGQFTASPVAGDGKIYVPSADGTMYVLRAGRTFEVIAENRLELERHTNASPAIAAGRIYVRGGNWLYSIVGTPEAEPSTVTNGR